MARVIPFPPGGTPPDDFEREVLEAFRTQLPDDYLLLPNFVIKPATSPTAFEIDVVVLAPHAIYVVECKRWFGRITGDDTEWLINGRIPKPTPMNLPDWKCKVLKTHLGPAGKKALVVPVYVIPDGSQVLVGGGWAQHLHTVAAAVDFLQAPHRVQAQGSIAAYHEVYVSTIQGAWGRRVRSSRRTIAGYVLEELMTSAEPGREDWLARRTVVDDPTPYRLRLWSVPTDCGAAERKRRLEVIKRPTEAVQTIGPHPNLLRVQEFAELADEGRFYEITEWSDLGTLHGFLRNREHPLTVRERLELGAGVASALVAIHGAGVVHRNLCPETILVGFDRHPRVTDFDRAYLDEEQSVLAAVRHRNLAYVPPELADPGNYDFAAGSDCYALGVLLYELFVGTPPFPNPQAAKASQGEPTTVPSRVVAGVDPQLDDLVLALLNTEDFSARPTATHALELLRSLLGSSTGASAGPQPATPRPVSFEPGSIVGDFLVEGLVGEGSFAKVYKVKHLVQGKTWAMKVVKDAADSELATEEWKTGDDLPRHPNIAEIRWLSTLPAPDHRPYVICELVEGESLVDYCNGKRRLPLVEVRRIGLRLLEALDALHPQRDRIAALTAKTLTPAEAETLEKLKRSGYLHRDIKPSNVLLDRRNEPKLIDFNIATPADRAVGKAGTPRYWAPDRGQGEPSEDLFSLGVVLYELCTGAHPFPREDPSAGEPFPPSAVAPHLRLSAELSNFLVRAVKPRHADRFRTARAMHSALEGIGALHGPPPVDPPEPAGDELDLGPDEACRANYNPFVQRLLTLYSQARVSNAGTRGLDAIARMTYVPTRLDTELAPAILNGQHRLVVVTGNAGDGKTAFLQHLEEHFRRSSADFRTLTAGNGAAWSLDGVRWQSNYDGSQDEGDVHNDAVLDAFLQPFQGSSMVGLQADEARLLAINEGRLRDFLDHSAAAERYPGLQAAVTRFFLDGVEPPPGLLIVNLNQRAVAQGGAGSLVERQLLGLLDRRIWKPCDGCAHRERCPLLSNARTLSDPASGPAVRERVRRLFEVVHLRRQQHVTMRDLRSALSWLLLRDTSCAEVAELVDSPSASRDLAMRSYTQAFAAEPAGAGGWPESRDRLVRALADLDVGHVEQPDLDRRLDQDPATALPWLVFESRAAHQDKVWQALFSSTPTTQMEADIGGVLARRRALIRMLRRRAWFERRDGAWTAGLPYRSLGLVERAMDQGPGAEVARADLRLRIVEGLSLLEGARHPDIRRSSLCLRTARVRGASALSFRVFDATGFVLDVDHRVATARFVEYAPDTLIFRTTGDTATRAELRLNLDLVEVLEMVRRGYRPSNHSMGALLVNIVIFRNALLHVPHSEVLVTLDNERFYTIAGEQPADGSIRLKLTDRSAAEAAP